MKMTMPQYRWVAGMLLGLGLATGLLLWTSRRAADRELGLARIGRAGAEQAPFDREMRKALSADGVSLFQSRSLVRDIAWFRDAWFAATDGGLVELDNDGRIKRAWTVLDGLPESDLLCLAEYQSKLMIGTRSQGLVRFDGARFEQFRWTDRKAQGVTALAADRGRMLIGTFAGGLLEFDGRQFQELKGGAPDRRLNGINFLHSEDSKVFAGTFNEGLWLREGDRWSQFTIADGLPSNRVVGVVPRQDSLLVATDFGVAAMRADRRFQSVATLPATAGMIGRGETILVNKDNGELFELRIDARSGNGQLKPVDWRGPQTRPANLSSCQLRSFLQQTGQTSGQGPEQALWLLSNEGIWRTAWQDERFAGRIEFSDFGGLKGANAIANNEVSAIAADEAGRLWIGGFRNGIEILSADGRRLLQLESETIREINALVWDGEARRMLAASSAGLLRIDETGRAERIGRAEGLLSDSVSHVAILNGNAGARLAIATGRGLSLGDAKHWQGLGSVQGLPSPSVYTVLPHREFLFAGTLNGLAQIAAGRVVRVYKDSNSRLATNWVTSLAAAGNRLFIGAYGGGVFELTAAGELQSFASQMGRQTVNPNALLVDGRWLLAGTLDGVWAADLETQRWLHLSDELPARTVMSFAAAGDSFYFGTTAGVARVKKTYLNQIGE
jgi:ligand-binding sensor domain-containing protein